MPPPATIYGHICSTLGEWVSPEGVEFAYHFTYGSKFDEVEHTHIVTPATGKLPGTGFPKVLEGAVNPFKRTLLFKPRLVLYLNKPEWEPAFRSPRYAVALGRSQDLFTYTSVSVVDLLESDRAYFEHTLAPYRMGLQAPCGFAVLMPRFLDYNNGRQSTFARYVVVNRRFFSDELLRFEGLTSETVYWIDPSTTEVKASLLGLLFHAFVGEYDDAAYMA